ncbi:STAS domain-containing protein [Streptomyces sp. RKAG293]|uniref:STAS domain-containing protein n=1 Tax=Streptomyces sp. RKAG293 TaxID=2893403 RepID=UPI002034878E|nr:STAS domain-containing protein [Streptomyces sp. RKAG293]MCM2419104.1 STAS domain-containing protein [Streptomyces sp. RKAG293]
MPIPLHLTAHRRDRQARTLITLSGDIDLDSAPLLNAALEQCLHDGSRTIDVDLSAVTFCDCTGLNTFLFFLQRATAVGGTLRLHRPPVTVARLFSLTDTSSLLLAPSAGHTLPPPVPLLKVPRRLASVMSAARDAA